MPASNSSAYIPNFRCHWVLECGFGGGRVIRHLSKYGYDIEGIERDAGIVDKLKALDNSLKIFESDILSLPFEDDRFDTTLCFGVVNGMESDMAKALLELKRVTKREGTVIVSVLLDNLARKMQQFLCSFFSGEEKFYSWLDSEEGWRSYFKTFGLDVVDSRLSITRYSIYYWTPFLRSFIESDLRLARVKDDEYKLNLLGRLFWGLHKTAFRRGLAGGISFVLRNGPVVSRNESLSEDQ